MDWIKRNLYFLIGGTVALALMGLAGWYLFSMWQKNNAILEDLDKEYGELANLNNLNPHPGSSKVDNIKIAKEQRQQLRDYIQKARPYFQRIAPVPDLPKLTDREFSAALSRAIDQMQRDAASASVSLQPQYSFSFATQKQGLTFAPGSLPHLSVQLGEVKAICDILFQAKINWLDNIRRERVSPDDFAGLQTDYLAEQSVTNDLAVLSPYELTFRCFSSELASVMAGFAGSDRGFIVKTINVEPAPSAATESVPGTTPTPVPSYTPPAPVTPPVTPYPMGEAMEGPSRKFGGPPPRAHIPFATPAPAPPPTPAPYAYPARPAAVSAGPARVGGLPTVLDEKLLKVTLGLDVVKLLPAK